MPAMKRPAAANAQVAKIAKVIKETPTLVPFQAVNPFTEKCDLIAAALTASAGSATEMLIDMLPFAAQPPPRHNFQEVALAFVGHELDNKLEEIRSKVAELQTKLAGVDEEQLQRSAAVEAAVVDVERKTGAHTEAQNFLARQRSLLQEAAREVAAAIAAQKKGDIELDASVEREHMITSAIEQKAALETVLVEEPGLKSRAEKLGQDCRLFIDDAGLLTALTMSLGKVPEVRGVFDNMVLLQFSEEMTRHLVASQRAIAEGHPGKTARATNLQECKALHLAANDAVMSAVVVESDVDVAKQVAEAVVKTSNANVADLSAEIVVASAELLSAQTRLAEFESGPVAAFAQLLDPEACETVPTAGEEEVMALGKGESMGDSEEATGGDCAVTGEGAATGTDADNSKAVGQCMEVEVKVVESVGNLAHVVDVVGECRPADDSMCEVEAARHAKEDGAAAVA